MKSQNFLVTLPPIINDPGALGFYDYMGSCDEKSFRELVVGSNTRDVDHRLAKEIGTVSSRRQQLTKRLRVIHEVVSRSGTSQPMTVSDAENLLGGSAHGIEWVLNSELFKVKVDSNLVLPSSELHFFLNNPNSEVFKTYESVRKMASEFNLIPIRPEGWRWQLSVRKQLEEICKKCNLKSMVKIFPIKNDNGQIELTSLESAYVTLFDKTDYGRYGTPSAVGKTRPYISADAYAEIVTGGGRVDRYVQKVRAAIDSMNWNDIDVPFPESAHIRMWNSGGIKWIDLEKFLDGIRGVVDPLR